MRYGIPGVAILTALWLGLGSALAAGPDEGGKLVLAEGDPPLTQERADRCGRFFEWLLETRLTNDQRETIQDYLVGVWTNKDANQMANAVSVLDQYAQIEKLDPATRDLAREEAQPRFIASWRKQDDPLCKWAAGVYDAAHQPIVAGDPPLTRQVSDATLEVLCFVVSEVRGGQRLETGPVLKEHWAKMMAADYAQLGNEQKKVLAEMPTIWAALRAGWVQMPEDKKAEYRTQWKGQFKPALEAMERNEAESQKQTRNQTTSELIQKMNEENEKARMAMDKALEQASDPIDKRRLLLMKLRGQQATAGMISNMSTTMHQANMAVINNIGNSSWRYEYRPK